MGLRWVFVNGLKRVQKLVLGRNNGSKVGRNPLFTHFKPISDFRENLPFSQFKGDGNCFLKGALRQSRPNIRLPPFSKSLHVFRALSRGRSLKGRCNIRVCVPPPPLTPPMLWGRTAESPPPTPPHDPSPRSPHPYPQAIA